MNIQTVQFHNQEIQVLNYEGKPYVAMKPICENIGLNWDSQKKRINRNEILFFVVSLMKLALQRHLQDDRAYETLKKWNI